MVALCSVVFVSGCGNTRTKVPTTTAPAAPAGFHTLGYPQAGVVLSAPSNWSVQASASPQVATISSGPAVVALWRFPRSSPLPAGARALQAALRQLVAMAQARDATLQLIRSRVETIDGVPAVELDAFERIGGQERRVRSTHVFTPAAELVLDEYAPPAIFHAVDHAVFSPVKRSLRLSPA